MTDIPYHIPALLKETIELLHIQPDGVYVDATFGGGGHSRAILDCLGNEGKLIVFDQDADAFANQKSMKNSLLDDDRVIAVNANFKYIKRFLRFYGIAKIDGVLADLGVSFHHFDAAERGFSFRTDAPLDMRMNQHAQINAQKVLNNYTEQQLADIFYLYGELRQSRQIASAICRARAKNGIETTSQLIDIVKPFLKNDREKKELACVFQALRIAVNDEMGALKTLLYDATEALTEQGRFVILSYHSIEDRIVKNFFKTGNAEGRVEKDFYGNILAPLKPESNKAIVADQTEIDNNPRARSAKLRAAVKTKDNKANTNK